jgi:hypothetical protein
VFFRNFLLGVSCVLVQAAFFAGSGASDDRSELHRRNQELAARDYELRDGHLTIVRIGLRKRHVEPGWLSMLFGVSQDSKELEVVAYLKSGEALPIERISTVISTSPLNIVSAWPTIIDSAGAVVGYFQSSLTEVRSEKAHRVAFIMYFVGKNGLIRREGEAKCEYIGSEGLPNVKVANARWDPELRELEFDLRSNCYHVSMFGAGPRRILNMIDGEFNYDPKFSKSNAWVDLAQRVTVSFDTSGDTFTFAVAKGDAEKRKAFSRCVENAKTAAGFHICSDGTTRRRAFWQFGTDRVSMGLSCELGSDVAGKTYFVSACPGRNSNDDGTNLWIDFTIASQDAPRGIEANIECSCNRLWVDRLSFNPQLRTLVFNLDTDAKVIKFAGGEFQVPTIASRALDGRVAMEIPVFTIRFNEQWQIVEMTTVVSDTLGASGR